MKTGTPEQAYSHIFWDWNGTLLDDVTQSMDCFNHLLAKRGLPLVEGVNEYRNHFSFPVQDYYRRVGFDLEREPIEHLAVHYMKLYHAPDMIWSLHNDVEPTLQWMADQGIRQVILTASERGYLDAQMTAFDIRPYFDTLLTLDDIHARSKIAIGQAYLEGNAVRKGLMIGDTLHDYEVANALGLDCLLISRGHNSREILETSGAPVFDNLIEARSFLKPEE